MADIYMRNMPGLKVFMLWLLTFLILSDVMYFPIYYFDSKFYCLKDHKDHFFQTIHFQKSHKRVAESLQCPLFWSLDLASLYM